MNIQRSINQMLATGGIAMGLYANSPQGKVASERKALKQNVQANEEKRALMALPAEGDIPEEVAKPYQQNLAEGYQLAERAYELDPSEETYDKMIEEGKSVNQFEERLKRNLEERTATKQAQKEAMETRKKLLENAPITIGRKTKVEVNANGKE